MRNWVRFAILAGALAGSLPAAQVIGTVAVNPTSIVAGTPTLVTVTAVVSDPGLIAGSVNLQQRDSTGRKSAVNAALTPAARGESGPSSRNHRQRSPSPFMEPMLSSAPSRRGG